MYLIILSTDYIVRKYRRGDEYQIVELLSLVFDGWPHIDLDCDPLEYWIWRYRDNPTKKSIVTVAESHNRIIGCHHVFEVKIKVGNKIYPGGTSSDLAVHPNYRRMGISKKMREGFSWPWSKKEGILFDYFIIGNPILVERFKKTKQRLPANIINLAKIGDIRRQLQIMSARNELSNRIGFYVVRSYQNLKNALREPVKRQEEFNIIAVDIFDDRINVFWNRIYYDYDFIVQRDKDVLNWRYCDSRIGKYLVKLALNKKEIMGYIVYRINRYNEEYPVGYVVDLLALPDRLDVVNELLGVAVQFFEDNGVNIINYQVASNHPYRSVFERHGFLDSRVKLHIFYQPSDSKMRLSIPPQTGNVYLSWGDHDILPVSIPQYD